MSLADVEILKKKVAAIRVRIGEAEQLVGNIITGKVDYPNKSDNLYRIDTKTIAQYKQLCNKKMPISQIVDKFDALSRASLYIIIENAGRKNNEACLRHVGEHYNVLSGIKKTLEQINL